MSQSMFAKRLYELREERNMPQKDLAKQVHLSQQAISFYEKGERQPSFDVLRKFSEFFDVSADYLLGFADHRR